MIEHVLTPADAPAIAALWHAGAIESAQSHPSFYPIVPVETVAESIGAELSDAEMFGWGIVDDTSGRLVAYLTAKVSKPNLEFRQTPFLYLLDLDVHRDFRRQGLGAKLVAIAKAHAAREALSGIEVNWLTEDAQASAFWKNQGFTQYIARGRFVPEG